MQTQTHTATSKYNTVKDYTTHHSTYTKRRAPQKSGYSDVILAQCIICAIAFAVVMGFCVIDTPFTQEVQAKLATAISDGLRTSDIEEMASSVQSTLDDVTALSVNTTTVDIPAISPDDTTNGSVTTSPEFRIDEDILAQMDQKVDVYGASEKKPLTPSSQPTESVMDLTNPAVEAMGVSHSQP